MCLQQALGKASSSLSIGNMPQCFPKGFFRFINRVEKKENTAQDSKKFFAKASYKNGAGARVKCGNPAPHQRLRTAHACRGIISHYSGKCGNHGRGGHEYAAILFRFCERTPSDRTRSFGTLSFAPPRCAYRVSQCSRSFACARSNSWIHSYPGSIRRNWCQARRAWWCNRIYGEFSAPRICE